MFRCSRSRIRQGVASLQGQQEDDLACTTLRTRDCTQDETYH